jgi:hypothetical protein
LNLGQILFPRQVRYGLRRDFLLPGSAETAVSGPLEVDKSGSSPSGDRLCRRAVRMVARILV